MTSYLVFPDLASAQVRSHQQAVAKGCTGETQYWWGIVSPVLPPDGSVPHINVKPREQFDAVFSKNAGGCGETWNMTIFMPDDSVNLAGCIAAEFDHIARKQRGERITVAQFECFGDRAAIRVGEQYGEFNLVRSQEAWAKQDCGT